MLCTQAARLPTQLPDLPRMGGAPTASVLCPHRRCAAGWAADARESLPAARRPLLDSVPISLHAFRSLIVSPEFERARGRGGEVSALISHSHSFISTFGRMPVSLTAARRQRGIRCCVPGVWNLTPMRLVPAHRMGLAALGKFTTTPRVRAPALRPGRERNAAAGP